MKFVLKYLRYATNVLVIFSFLKYSFLYVIKFKGLPGDKGFKGETGGKGENGQPGPRGLPGPEGAEGKLMKYIIN